MDSKKRLVFCCVHGKDRSPTIAQHVADHAHVPTAVFPYGLAGQLAYATRRRGELDIEQFDSQEITMIHLEALRAHEEVRAAHKHLLNGTYAHDRLVILLTSRELSVFAPVIALMIPYFADYTWVQCLLSPQYHAVVGDSYLPSPAQWEAGKQAILVACGGNRT